MNKKILRYSILFIFLIAGIITAAVGISMGAKEDYTKMLNMTNIDAMVPSDGVVSLNIDVTCADVEITASNDVSGFEISAQNIPRNFLKYTVSNNILNLKYSFNKWYEVSSLPLLMKNKGTIKITVPAKSPLQDIQIESSMCQANISYLTAENIYINCGSGNNCLTSINADYIEISGGSGDIKAENLRSDRLSVSGGGGNSTVTDFQANKAAFQSGTGDVSVFGSINGDCTLESGFGDLTAEFIGNVNDYDIDVIKGKANLNGQETTGTEVGNYRMDISAGMGDVNVSFV